MFRFETEYKKMFKEAMESGRENAYKVAGDNVMIYPCGFAWIRVHHKQGDQFNNDFIKWLIKNDLGDQDRDKKRNAKIWVSYEYNQSMNHKSAHAEAMCKVFKENGISATYGDRID